MKKIYRIAISSLLLIVGIALIVYGQNLLPSMSMGPLAMTPQGKVGIAIETDIKSRPPFLATVAPGATYQWKVTFKNTGNVNWDKAVYHLRIVKDGGTTVWRSCTSCPSECSYCGWTATNCAPGYDHFYADKCDSKCDTTECRIDLSSWDMQIKKEGYDWYDISPYQENRVANFGWGTVSPGSTETWYFKLKAPQSGYYHVIVGTTVWIGSTRYEFSKVDTISVGTVNGDLTLTFIGALSLISAVAALIYKRW